jgi:hypothetical protein
MISANNMQPVGFSLDESHFEQALIRGLAETTRKYDTSVTLTPNIYTQAPTVITDAVIAANCSAGTECEVPEVLTNTTIQMNAACNICLTDLTDGQRAVYGVELADPQPTAALISAKEREQAIKLTYSMMKTYWLGDKSYVAADLQNAALLPAYKKDDGQWKKILSENPATVTITQNAALTLAGQMALTFEDVIGYLKEVLDRQSTSLKMVLASEKIGWLTDEIFNIVMDEKDVNNLRGIAFTTIENEFGPFPAFTFRGSLFVNYEHFTAAIKDLANPEADALELPHRIIYTVGLPMISFPIGDGTAFSTDFVEPTRKFTAATLATIQQPEAVAGDYYVVAY